MGHLPEKYDRTYFLGGVDPETGTPYGVLGHQEFKDGGIHERLRHEADVTIAFLGSLDGRHVLDVGMGRGDRIPMLLREAVGGYTGIDMSTDAVRIARERFDDPRVRLRLGEAAALDDEGVYDLIMLFDVIEHIPVFEMETVWPRLHRALRPGGCVFMSTPIFLNPNVADHTDGNPSVSGIHCNKQTEGTLIRSFLRHGFTVVYVEERIFGVVRTGDLPLFEESRRAAYTCTHAAVLARAGALPGMSETEVRDALVPPPGRIAVGCVLAENPRSIGQALRLLSSLRLCGGQMAGASFFACFLRMPDKEYAREFERLGAIIRVVPRTTAQDSCTNKLGFFALPELRHYDTLLLLDGDTAVVRDPLPFISGRALQCAAAELPTAPRETVARVFAHFGAPLPPRDCRCAQGGDRPLMYCDAGVVAMPAWMLDDFVPRWRDYHRQLAERPDLFEPLRLSCEQASLSLAQATERVASAALPVEMNFPTHLARMSTLERMSEVDPAIIRFHDDMEASGLLRPVAHALADRRIEQLNQLLRQKCPRWFGDRTVLDFPHSRSPGPGSRVGLYGDGFSHEQELREPIFVLGAMRSGTTLLADFLGRFPGIIRCPFELKDIWSKAGGVSMASPKTRETQCLELGAEDVRPGQRERLSAAFLERMRANAAGKRPGAAFLNKNPHLCNKVPLVNALFPDARFIWIHRPLHQVVVSLRELFAEVNARQGTWHCWPEPGTAGRNRCWQAFHRKGALAGLDPRRVFPGGDITCLAEYWLESNRAIRESLAMIPRSRWHEVSEVKLLRDPDEAVRECLKFLGDVATGEFNLHREIDRSRDERWQSMITGEERSAIEDFLAD